MDLPEPPELIISGLSALSELDSKTVDDIVVKLPELQPSIYPRSIAKQLAVPGIDERQLERIVEMLAGFHRMGEDVPLETVIKFVRESVQRTDRLMRLTAERQEFAVESVRRLLQAEGPLSFLTKAFEVLTDNERLYSESRIVSDMRSIFKKPEDLPVAATVMHTLRITYQEALGQREFYVSLDEGDLVTLREQIDRALTKSGSLKKVLQLADIQFLSATQEDTDARIN